LDLEGAKAILKPILDRLYFALEGADRKEFGEAGRYEARKKELEEILLSSADHDLLLTAVVALVAEHPRHPRSALRLLAEFQSTVCSHPSLLRAAGSSVFLSSCMLTLTRPDLPVEMRAFAASGLVPHTQALSGLPPQSVLQAETRLKEEDLRLLSRSLQEAVLRKENELSSQLLKAGSRYMGCSEAMKDALLALATAPPEDPDLKHLLLITITGQAWPVHEIPPVFDFLLKAIDPATPRFLQAAMEAFRAVPQFKAEDPRAKAYLDRLGVAYRQIDESLKGSPAQGRDLREGIVRSALSIDHPGTPQIYADYLAKPEVPLSIKQELLEELLQRAHSLRGSSPALIQSLSGMAQQVPDPKVQDLIKQCITALSR
jgi:hypothetical protein